MPSKQSGQDLNDWYAVLSCLATDNTTPPEIGQDLQDLFCRGKVGKSQYAQGKTSGRTVVESGGKWRQVAASGGKWRQVAASGRKVAASGSPSRIIYNNTRLDLFFHGKTGVRG